MGHDLPERRSVRLVDYDYSQAGAYFVTLCTRDHQCLFGRIMADAVELNDAGRMADTCWHGIPAHFPLVEVDAFVIMPNHVHGILFIRAQDDLTTSPPPSVGANNHSPVLHSPVPTNNRRPTPPRPRGTSRTIGSIVRGFKIGVMKRMQENAVQGDIWQRNYYEHVIRSERSLNLIRQYIADNPASWARDKYGPGE